MVEVVLDFMKFDKVCYIEGEIVKVKMEINWKGGIKCEGGVFVEEIIKKVYFILIIIIIKMVSVVLEEVIKDDNVNVILGVVFIDKKFIYEFEVLVYIQLIGFDVIRNVIKIIYVLLFVVYNKVMKVIEKKIVEVIISKIFLVVVRMIEVIGYGYGYGYGDDLNVGGGIIIFE